MADYQLHNSVLLKENKSHFIDDCYRVKSHFETMFPGKDATWDYKYYNIFAATSPSPLWYDLFKELCGVVRTYAGDDRPLWMQSWLNFHTPDQVLDWHGHDWPFHGYISVDPKDTNTSFEGYSIKNETGAIYIGPGHRLHKVEVNSTYEGHRITLGFDVTDEMDRPYEMFSMIPVL